MARPKLESNNASSSWCLDGRKRLKFFLCCWCLEYSFGGKALDISWDQKRKSYFWGLISIYEVPRGFSKNSLGKSKLVFLIIIIKNKYLQEIGLEAIWPKHICKGGHKALKGHGESMVQNGTIYSFSRFWFRSPTGKGIYKLK